jgi:hypothetical protein
MGSRTAVAALAGLDCDYFAVVTLANMSFLRIRLRNYRGMVNVIGFGVFRIREDGGVVEGNSPRQFWTRRGSREPPYYYSFSTSTRSRSTKNHCFILELKHVQLSTSYASKF